jgi:mono/diheme cytochrome c family protein
MLKTTAIILSLGTFLVGCAEDPVPFDPGYAADVQPIMMAHCVRCHGGGGKLNADPTSLYVDFKNLPPSVFYFDAYEDRGTCPGLAPECRRGAAYLANAASKAFVDTYLHPMDPVYKMPPAPAPALTERELAILDIWLSKFPPKP